jgi:hypothetical protein
MLPVIVTACSCQVSLFAVVLRFELNSLVLSRWCPSTWASTSPSLSSRLFRFLMFVISSQNFCFQYSWHSWRLLIRFSVACASIWIFVTFPLMINLGICVLEKKTRSNLPLSPHNIRGTPYPNYLSLLVNLII